jgi:hypothetical protein
MEKKILVPVTLLKDARLGDLDVDVELEVSCNLSHETAPARGTAPSQPEPAAWGLSGRPLAASATTAEPPTGLIPDLIPEEGPARDTEEQTMSFDTARASRAVQDALGSSARAAGKSLPVTKPAPKATVPRRRLPRARSRRTPRASNRPRRRSTTCWTSC